MVSVIIPIYNVEMFLRECIDSVLSQSYKELQVLLIDDGSTDSCPSICDQYAELDSRVEVVHQNNMGLSGARNTGIAHARGEWITIVDGDDWLDHDAIEKMLVAAAKESDCDVFIASYYASYPDKERKESFLTKDHMIFEKENMKLLQMSCLCATKISKADLATNVGVTWARLYKTAFLKNNDLEFKVGLKRMQDATFHLTAYEYANRVVYVNMPVYHYRLWNGAVSKKYSKDFENTAQGIIAEIKKYIYLFSPGAEFERCYYTKVTRLLLEIIRLSYAPKENTMPRKEKIERIDSIKKQSCYQEALKHTDIKMLSRNQQVMYILLRMGFTNVVYTMYEMRYGH